MSQEEIKVGNNIDAYCTKCKMDLGHTIEAVVDDAPARVICNTCRSQHNYRPPKEGKAPAAKKAKAATKAKATKKPKAQISQIEAAKMAWEEHINDKDPSKDKPYKMSDTFNEGEILSHDRFGRGVVLGATAPNKILVLFQDGEKILIQSRE